MQITFGETGVAVTKNDSQYLPLRINYNLEKKLYTNSVKKSFNHN